MFTSFAHFEANVATRLADRRSHRKGTFIKILVFAFFVHFRAKFVTRWGDRRSHGKVSLLRRLMFTCFAHFDGNIVTGSSSRRSHAKGALCSCSEVVKKVGLNTTALGPCFSRFCHLIWFFFLRYRRRFFDERQLLRSYLK